MEYIGSPDEMGDIGGFLSHRGNPKSWENPP